MNLMRKIIKWCDKKQDEAFEMPTQTQANAKTFVGGFVEGFCDGALLMYFPLLISCAIWRHKAENK